MLHGALATAGLPGVQEWELLFLNSPSLFAILEPAHVEGQGHLPTLLPNWLGVWDTQAFASLVAAIFLLYVQHDAT